MLPDDPSLEALMSSAEPGMNFISADFDLVMVNRTNERFYGRPVAELLGKKCHREFEHREEPCPHCPGRLAMATGESHETETSGYQPDGTRHFARIRAYPVMGPDNRPTGFIEVVENITGQKRRESLERIESNLQDALVRTKTVQKALRSALDAAMRIEGIDWACVFIVDQATGEHCLSSQRHVSPDSLEPLAAASRGVPASHAEEIPGIPPVLEVVPILYRDSLVATLLAGSSSYPALPATIKTGLHSLGAATGNAISRIWAEQSRGDAVADL
jgi:PAS domain S-box-containing protein